MRPGEKIHDDDRRWMVRFGTAYAGCGGVNEQSSCAPSHTTPSRANSIHRRHQQLYAPCHYAYRARVRAALPALLYVPPSALLYVPPSALLYVPPSALRRMRAFAVARRAPSRTALFTVGRHLPGVSANCPAAATPWDRRVPPALSADRILRCDAQCSGAGTGMWEERSGSRAGGGGSGDGGMRRECKGGARGSAWREAVARWTPAGADATQISLQGTQVESEGTTMWRAVSGGGWRSDAEARRGGAAEGPCALAGVGGRRYGVSAAGGGDAMGPAGVARDGGRRRAGGARGDAAHADERGAEGEAEWGEAYWRKQLERSAAAERGGGKGERRRRRKAKEGEGEAVEWWPGQRQQQQQQRGAGRVEEGGGADEELVAAVGMEVAHEKAMYLPPSVRPAPPAPPAVRRCCHITLLLPVLASPVPSLPCQPVPPMPSKSSAHHAIQCSSCYPVLIMLPSAHHATQCSSCYPVLIMLPSYPPILAGPPPPWRVEEREGVADLWLTRAFHGEQLRLMLLLQGHEGGLVDQGEEGREGDGEWDDGGAGEAHGSGSGVGGGESDAGIPALILVSKPVRSVQAGSMAARSMAMGMAGMGGREGPVRGRPVRRMTGEGRADAAAAAAAGTATGGGEGEARLRVHCTIAGDQWLVNHVAVDEAAVHEDSFRVPFDYTLYDAVPPAVRAEVEAYLQRRGVGGELARYGRHLLLHREVTQATAWLSSLHSFLSTPAATSRRGGHVKRGGWRGKAGGVRGGARSGRVSNAARWS
ncbi:unnamed protein product [Closterium sp. Naga37s-1]|nr:unnamed protein product [Closterium sp. Naga37s-1]